MTNLGTDQWNKMYKLISQHQFTISGDVNDDYKCGICKNILINAHQSICGCQFCYECINQYMASGASNCPNNAKECKLSSLSNIVPNYRMNKLISNLIARCSNKMCSHKGQLIEMENHLNSCLYKVVKCPFNDVGCAHGDMINEKLNDHMLSDIHNHNKILIDLIGNLRNEMRELKEKVDGNRLEIEMLMENDRVKNEIVESLKRKVEGNQIENESLMEKLARSLLEIELLKENDRRKNEIIESLKEEIKSIKQENENVKDQMETGDRNLWYKFDEIDMKMNEKCCKKKEEWNEKFDEKMRKENEKLDQTEISRKIDKYLNMRDGGELYWQIGEINEIKWMSSEYFYDKQDPYKMYLVLHYINNELNIWLHIRSGAFDDDLKWPCRADVTIRISALNDWYIYKSVTKLCTIEKNSTNWSDPIEFSHSDLTVSNLININCLLRCLVKFV